MRCGRIVSGEEHQDFGLERVGILKFVNKNMAEAILQSGAQNGIAADEITGGQQQVEKFLL